MSFWEEIEIYITNKGFSSDSLDSLLKFIDAPPIPIEIPRVLENFLELLKHLDPLVSNYPEHLTEVIDSDWEAMVRTILAHPDWVSKTASFRKKGKTPKGLYKYYAYIAVWTRPTYMSDWSNYFTLLAHVCLAVSNLRKWMEEQREDEELTLEEKDNFNYRIYRALLTVRSLANIKHLHILETLQKLDISPEQLLEVFQKNNFLLRGLSPLFKYLLKIRKSVHRQPGGTSPRARPLRVPIQLKLPAHVVDMGENLDPGQESPVPPVEVLQLPTQSDAEAEEMEYVGCTPDESASGVEIAYQKKVDKKVHSPRQKADYARTAKSHLAMRNQLLPGRWETLSLHEVSSFLAAVANLIDRRDRSPYLPSGTIPCELAALLTTMFWCGQRLERAVTFRYYGIDPVDATEPGFVPLGDLDGYWWTVPAVPARKLLPNDHQLTKVHATVHAFPLHSNVHYNERTIRKYVKDVHHGNSDNLYSPDSNYEEMVSSFLAEVNNRHKTRLTSNRISDYLFDSISQQSGSDITTAMFITGRYHPLGYNLSYYTAIPVATLQMSYWLACSRIKSRHFLERPQEKAKTNFKPVKLPKSTDYVGSPFTPTGETIINLVEELKVKLQDSITVSPGISKLIRLHNNMTRYTAYMIGFCTGFRAVRDPFLSAAEIDWRSGFAILSDKDNEDRYNSRLIWIPPVCLEQIKLFREHTHNALYRFSILQPDLYSQLQAPRRKGPGRYMFYALENEDTGSYETRNLGPKLIGKQLRNIYPLPFNASRHYLRSSLIARGCPVEVINAYMGHWERGEEAWGTYSGLSPLFYRDILQRDLEPLIKDANWEALPGLGSVL